MSYPYELELMEGDILLNVGRILQGKSLYAAPSLDSASPVYTPFYFYLSALAAKLLGARLFSLRLVSFLSTLGCLGLVYRFVQRETRSPWFGALSACLFAASFGATGFWFDLARPDMLYILFCLAAGYCARFCPGIRGAALAGGFFSFALLTKQTALLIVIPMILYFALVGRRELAVFAATFVVLSAAFLGYFQHASSGWCYFYSFGAVSTVLTAKSMIILFWVRQILPQFGMSALLSLFYVLNRWYSSDRRALIFYLPWFCGMAGASWAYSLNWGAYLNGLLPIAALLSILAGLGAHAALESFEILQGRQRTMVEMCLTACLLIQFGCLAFNPMDQIPGRADVEAGNRLAARLGQIPGRIFICHHATLYTAAGKEPSTPLIILGTLFASPNAEVANGLRQELREALRSQKFRAVVVDSDWFREYLPDDFRRDLNATYGLRETISYPDTAVFRERTGLFIRPQFIYLPKSDASP